MRVSYRLPLRALISFFALLMGFTAVGCSQSVDSVNINSRRPDRVFAEPVMNTDLQGSSLTIPTSATFSMGVQSAGGNSLRTQSSSPSFNMTGGIGVD